MPGAVDDAATCRPGHDGHARPPDPRTPGPRGPPDPRTPAPDLRPRNPASAIRPPAPSHVTDPDPAADGPRQRQICPSGADSAQNLRIFSGAAGRVIGRPGSGGRSDRHSHAAAAASSSERVSGTGRRGGDRDEARTPAAAAPKSSPPREWRRRRSTSCVSAPPCGRGLFLSLAVHEFRCAALVATDRGPFGAQGARPWSRRRHGQSPPVADVGHALAHAGASVRVGEP